MNTYVSILYFVLCSVSWSHYKLKAIISCFKKPPPVSSLHVPHCILHLPSAINFSSRIPLWRQLQFSFKLRLLRKNCVCQQYDQVWEWLMDCTEAQLVHHELPFAVYSTPRENICSKVMPVWYHSDITLKHDRFTPQENYLLKSDACLISCRYYFKT